MLVLAHLPHQSMRIGEDIVVAVLKMGWFGRGRIRTYDQGIHFAPAFPPGVDYLFIDAVVNEFASNWIKGLNDYPSGKHWEHYGGKLATVLYEYFGTVRP